MGCCRSPGVAVLMFCCCAVQSPWLVPTGCWPWCLVRQEEGAGLCKYTIAACTLHASTVLRLPGLRERVHSLQVCCFPCAFLARLPGSFGRLRRRQVSIGGPPAFAAPAHGCFSPKFAAVLIADPCCLCVCVYPVPLYIFWALWSVCMSIYWQLGSCSAECWLLAAHAYTWWCSHGTSVHAVPPFTRRHKSFL